ncbi:hypothetical protein ASPVEDRAFT_126076 [Aspergillus versicolor CBS 583.65]|uniref:Amidase domain-containing protein n=1 Tax=Aspergillus versicolor CBS 583.65 TaxID=1036611 RepID=A0A1L9P995_ASPVE|nr:uncharacterized protein ASPVEDRAFT_126076 [Aspergillus versicolor CBS 583.65]OJI98014.1 hypothetical protein ASPVEDRAFT_126076 [Aspergillus versicolor CBS 583.65]
MISPEWQELIAQKRAARDSYIPSAWRVPSQIMDKIHPEANLSAFDLLKESNLLTSREIEITESWDATALLGFLASAKISSLEVTAAFCKRAAIAQQLTNCLTEILFDKALDRARLLDEYLAREGKTMGPFHGLPISLKDTMMVKGEYATLGFVSYLKKPPAEENSVIVDMLLDAGAVLYVKTNVPQTLFICEGYNNVFGQTMNPHKLCLTPSGSSSGEGALVGFRGSVLGVGSDIGGSIRAPSLCCGAFGFKPTANRLPYAKQQALIPKGWPGIMPTLGPHATSARDLTLLFKSIVQGQPWVRDSTAQAVAWRDVPRKSKLRIGVWPSDPDFPVTPPVSRALASAVEKLKAAGHEVKLLTQPPSLKTAAILGGRSLDLDPDQSIFKILAEAGEEPIPALRELRPDELVSGREANLAEIWSINADKEDYREEWGRIWREEKLDVLLCPGGRTTAVPHGKYGVPAYTIIWNLLDFPSSVVPYLQADKSLDLPATENYDPVVVDKAPVGVQIVGWRFQDEEVLMATEVIAEVLAR